jgi:hypothetical protein
VIGAAKARAKLIIEPILNGQCETAAKLNSRSGCATIGDIIEQYLSQAEDRPACLASSDSSHEECCYGFCNYSHDQINRKRVIWLRQFCAGVWHRRYRCPLAPDVGRGCWCRSRPQNRNPDFALRKFWANDVLSKDLKKSTHHSKRLFYSQRPRDESKAGVDWREGR